MRKSKLLFILMTLAFLIGGVNSVWGAKYYKIRVVAVSAEGGTTPGMVYACGYGSRNVSHDWYSDITTGPWSDVYPKKDTGNPDVMLYAQEAEGASFLGWYDNANCTGSSLSTSKSYNRNHASIATSANEGDAPTTTFYAKFTSAEKNHIYASIQYTPDENHRGAFRDYSVSAPYPLKYSVPNQDFQYDTYDNSYTFLMKSIAVMAKRGYRFTNWTITGSWAWYKNRTYYETNSSPYINIPSSSTDPEHPATALVQANYEALPKDTLTLQKVSNRGSVSVSYYNWVDNESGNENEDDLLHTTVAMTNFALAETEREYVVYSTDQITMEATPASGYVFGGWYTVDTEGNKTKYSGNTSITLNNGSTETYFAHFMRPLIESDNFLVGMSAIESLEQAIAAASASDDKTILLLKNCTIPAGNYTIPAGVTLLIPYTEEQENPDLIIQKSSNEAVPTGAYRTLTLADGVRLNVFGTIEVGGCQSTGRADAGADIGIGRPSAPTYGHMVLNSGSLITLNNGAEFRAWGYVTGQGEIDARRGSVVKEQFQVMDWRGYDYTMAMMTGNHMVLPISQYYIQNIESPTKYHPGSKLLACTAVMVQYSFLSVVVQMNDAGIIGVYRSATDKDAAVFLMNDEDDSEDTWVRKYYDATTDKQVYEINNAAYLGSLVMKMTALGFNVTMNSAEYVLPITNNFKIHLLNGEMNVTQNTVLLPGAEIELDKKSTMYIPDTATLSLYDSEQWGAYVCNHWNSTTSYSFGYGTRIKYRPGGVPEVRNISTRDGQGDAKLTVHGTVNVEGRLFTTEGGAAITSTIADAGTVTFTNGAPTFSTSHFVEQTDNTNPHYVKAQCVSALLSNEVGSTYSGGDGFTETAGTPAGKSFCFMDIDGDKKGEWVSLTSDGCWAHDQNGVCYIKPHAYVPISIGEPDEKPDHTYRDEYAGTDSIYIMTSDISGNCQWWRVYPVEGHPELFECKHKDNHTFYYYDNVEGWIEKKFNVTFKNWDGTTLTYKDIENNDKDHYELPYGSHPQWQSADPTRTDDDRYTYAFSGWLPEITPSTIVTGDVVYIAQYEVKDRMYSITFNDAEDALIELTYCKLGDVPACSRYTPAANEEWTPAISAVTGDQIYKLQARNEDGPFTISFVNWDGTPIQSSSVDKDANPSAPANPTKEADDLYTYTFAGWKAVDGTIYASNAIPAATEHATYTAAYNKADKTFTIRFFQEDGSTPIGDPQNLVYGAMPNVPNYSKENPAEHTEYTLVWSPLVSAATKDQDYVATFTEKPRQYTVTWKNYDGTTLETNYVNYGTTPVYSGVTPTNEEDPSSSFSGWAPAITAVKGDQVYTAQFTTEVLTISNGNPKTAIENETVGATTIIITKSGTVDLSAAGSSLSAENLILESDGSVVSGQLIATNEQIHVTGNVYFDYKVNAKNHQWYGVAVPWRVDATTGISVNGKILELGKDFDIIYYNGELRASVGKQKCWSYVEDDVNKTLQPGRLYMIGLMMDAATIRFEKKSGADILTTTTSVTAHASAVATDAGWNGVANPALYHAFVNAGALIGQVYNPETKSYTPLPLGSQKWVVGQGAFVQAPNTLSEISVAGGGSAFAAAPRRARAEEAPLYDVRIAAAEAEYTDRLFVTIDEEKEEDKYVIGKDLAKVGVSKQVAQMWVARYNTELCMNTMAPVNGVAEYPLGIFAPKAGEYTIYINSAHAEYDMYLTFNGEAIWNLSDAAYTGTFDAGTTSAYGLRISARAPQITTGIDEAVVDAKGETRKVLIDNQVFIIRGEKVYSVDGQLVK